MNLKEAILKEHSKHQTTKIVNWIGNDKKRFSELVKLFLKGENIIKQRAGWPLSYAAEAHPELAKPHLKKLLENLKDANHHDAVKRNTFRLLEKIDVPQTLQGLAMEMCLKYMTSAKETVAVKCFAMTTASNICKQHPELARELKMIISEMLLHPTPGITARAKRTLKELDRA